MLETLDKWSWITTGSQVFSINTKAKQISNRRAMEANCMIWVVLLTRSCEDCLSKARAMTSYQMMRSSTTSKSRITLKCLRRTSEAASKRKARRLLHLLLVEQALFRVSVSPNWLQCKILLQTTVQRKPLSSVLLQARPKEQSPGTLSRTSLHQVWHQFSTSQQLRSPSQKQ